MFLHNKPLWLLGKVSAKGSCAADNPLRDDIGSISQYELFVDDGFTPRQVALGKVFERANVLHNMSLSPDVVKVMVEKVHIVYVVVPMPTYEVFTVAQAFQTFIM